MGRCVVMRNECVVGRGGDVCVWRIRSVVGRGRCLDERGVDVWFGGVNVWLGEV